MAATGIRVRTYDVLHRAVEEGVRQGYRRAHKHTEAPSADGLQDAISVAVMDAICEYFNFDDPNQEN